MLGAALVAVLVADREQLVADHLQQALGAREDVAQVADDVEQLVVLGQDLVLLEAGQAVQPQVEDRLGLRFGQAVDRRRAGRAPRRGPPAAR